LWSVGLGSAPEVYAHEKVFVPRLLELARDSRHVLEVGSGKGRMLNVLRSGGAAAQLVGIDVNPLPPEVRANGVVGDARRLPFSSEAFDLVFSLGVIEHWPGTVQAVHEHARVTRTGGHVLVTTPHLSVYTPARWLSYAVRGEFRLGSFEHVRGRNLTLRFVRSAFSTAGLDVIDSGASGTYSVSVSRLLGSKVGLMPQQAHLWVLGRKR
jgi:SAM-dependent methyltransferase